MSRTPQIAPRSVSGTRKTPSGGRLIGYARVSTEDQQTDAQSQELSAAGCVQIVTEHGSGASRTRPALARLLREIRAGDVLVVVRLDRLARSVSHLLAVIEDLAERSAHFRSLRDPIDTSTPQGMFSLQVLGAVAQLERALISERTKAGIRAAKAKGKLPGNPGLRSRAPEAIAKVSAARKATFDADLIASMDGWIPTVKRLRSDHSWDDIARILTQRGHPFTPDRLRRSVRRLAAHGFVAKTLLNRPPRRLPDDRLMTLVAGIWLADPSQSLRDIGARLEQLHERTPRGGTRWSPSTVGNLLERARALGLAPAGQPQ